MLALLLKVKLLPLHAIPSVIIGGNSPVVSRGNPVTIYQLISLVHFFVKIVITQLCTKSSQSCVLSQPWYTLEVLNLQLLVFLCHQCELRIAEMAQGTHSDILTGGPTEVHILQPKTSQLQNLFTKKFLLFSINPKKSHTNSKVHLCYCWFELMKNTIPKKINVFHMTQKNPSIFHRPQKIPMNQNFRPKKTPVIKIK